MGMMINGQIFYWRGILIALAAAAALCTFLALYLGRGGKWERGLLTVCLSLLFSLLLGRLVHWYCCPERYGGVVDALIHLNTGEFALIGCFGGCFLAAVMMKWLHPRLRLGAMLDKMSLAGCVGISLGRLASFFDATDRGQVLAQIRSMPWAYPVVNRVSGTVEYRLATFLLQAMAAGMLFCYLSALYRKKRKPRHGDLTLIFLLCYSASQIVLDSTRYDSLYFPWNRFVSVVQVAGAVAVAAVIVIFSVRLVAATGFRPGYLALWAGILALMGCAGYMEYYVQRHGNQAVFAYSCMSVSLLLLLALTLYIRKRALSPTRKSTRYRGKYLRKL